MSVRHLDFSSELENLFSEEEAKIALSLKPYPELVAVVAERINREEYELGQILYDMSKKGLILRFKESEEGIYYFLAPWVVGIGEFQLNRLNKENIPLYEKFHQEGIVASAVDHDKWWGLSSSVYRTRELCDTGLFAVPKP